jgi:RNA exonuclease 4
MKDRVLIGHSIKSDMKVLILEHPKRLIRDTARYKPFRKMFKGRTPSLKKLSKAVLNIDIQGAEHCSVRCRWVVGKGAHTPG